MRDTELDPQQSARQETKAARPKWLDRRGLSAKLLLFTVLFVMLAEVLIFVPSIAFFRLNWLVDRLNLAQVAALVAEAAPDGDLPEMLRDELLRSADVRLVALKRSNQRRLILSGAIETPAEMTFDLRGDSRTTSIRRSPAHWVQLISDALLVFVSSEKSYVRVIGEPAMGAGELIEIVMPLRPLRQAMIQHAINVLALSIIISLLTAGAVYFTLNRLLVAPMMRLTKAMTGFSKTPEDPGAIIRPSGRTDEIGTAERELAAMQQELHHAFAQKSRLAALGLAVSKINHDMRNLLASAQLLSDRLAGLPDPQVQRFAPKLIASLDRAIRYCNESLQFGRAVEPAPKRDSIALLPLAAEVAAALGPVGSGNVALVPEIPATLTIDADRDQLYRALTNIVRNAVEVLATLPPERRPTVRIEAHRQDSVVTIDVIDNGPGLSAQASANLFRPFQGSSRVGGTGLGLVIAQEIILAHGGRIDYVTTAEQGGAHFRIEIPDRAP